MCKYVYNFSSQIANKNIASVLNVYNHLLNYFGCQVHLIKLMLRARNAHGPERRGEGVREAAKLLGFSKKPLLGLRDLRDDRI